MMTNTLVQTNITPHAHTRLLERTSLQPNAFLALLDDGKTVPIGTEYNSSRTSHLFFSEPDKGFFIAIKDSFSGYVVTVLTIAYWMNLRAKHTADTKTLSTTWFFQAIRLINPTHPLLIHVPRTHFSSVRFSIVLDNPHKLINASSLPLAKIYSPATAAPNNLSSYFTNLFDQKSLDPRNIHALLWHFGKDHDRYTLVARGAIDFAALAAGILKSINQKRQSANAFPELQYLLSNPS